MYCKSNLTMESITKKVMGSHWRFSRKDGQPLVEGALAMDFLHGPSGWIRWNNKTPSNTVIL